MYIKTNWVDDVTDVDATNMNHLEDGVEKAYGVELLAVVDTAPSECSVGDKYFNTTTNKIYEATATDTWNTEGYDAESGVFYVVFSERAIYTYNGTTLVGVGSSGAGGESLPVGVSVAYMGTTAPQGYLMEDGTLKLISEYPELYNVLGHRYDLPTDTDNTKFRLPNKCGRVLVGLDSTQTEFDTLGKTGGEKTHTLTIDEMPSHNHGIPFMLEGVAHSGSGNNLYGKQNIGDNWGTTTSNTGGGQTHNNLQPYIVVNYIIKAHPSAVNTSEVVNEHSTSETDVYSANQTNVEIENAVEDIYSTNEVKTNKVYIDENNKKWPVYKKVINTTSPSSTNNWVQIATISNLRDIIKLEGWVYASNGRILPVQFSEPNAEISTTIYNNGIEMKVILSNWCDASCKMIAEYTKTTD